jgi:hypothetical protein
MKASGMLASVMKLNSPTSHQCEDHLVRKERRVADARNAYIISVEYFVDLGRVRSKIINDSKIGTRKWFRFVGFHLENQ